MRGLKRFLTLLLRNLATRILTSPEITSQTLSQSDQGIVLIKSKKSGLGILAVDVSTWQVINYSQQKDGYAVFTAFVPGIIVADGSNLSYDLRADGKTDWMPADGCKLNKLGRLYYA